MERTRILVSQFPGIPDPWPVAAACRAGATGVFDCRYLPEPETISCLEQLLSHTDRPFGLVVPASRPTIIQRLPEHHLPVPDPLVLSSPFPDTLQESIAALRAQGARLFLECLDLDHVRLAGQWAVDGIIARGNEAAGPVASESSFILLQRILAATSLPVYVQGGIGPHTAAACMAAGAAGVVLDCQCALARESSLPDQMRGMLASFDGTQTRCLELPGGGGIRIASRINRSAAESLIRELALLIADGADNAFLEENVMARLAAAVSADRGDRVWLLGQDIGLAAGLAERFVTVGGIVAAICDHVNRLPTLLSAGDILRGDAPLAASHGTRYPIVQGPMARISDSADFALAVAEAGGLPFLAAAMLEAGELESMLAATARCLGKRPWGVGLLGFLPPDRYRAQVEVVLRHRPPFALIAGGRPEQARLMEEQGIATYLHVPTPGLLRMFLRAGASRFIFEGREAGGHVAPLSSFVLWEQMIGVLLDFLGTNPRAAGKLHVLFAGGIHDSLSAAMVAAMAADLDRAGVRVGLQLGSVYLFTEEIVRTGALHEQYRREVLAGEETVLLETGPGHASRCVRTPFTSEFLRQRAELRRQGLTGQEIRDRLELLNLGKLRLAAKGVDRRRTGDGTQALVRVDSEEQHRQGVFMVGQLTALHREVTTVADVHREVIEGGHRRLRALVRSHAGQGARSSDARPADIAVIGMAGVLPGARSIAEYWQNILAGRDAVTEVPPGRWDWRRYYDPDPEAEDRCYSRWGAFIDDIVFDPVSFGMPPASLASVEPLQLLALEMARRALADAGYGRRPFAREHASVILGISGAGELGQLYSFRAALPMFFGDAATAITDHFRQHLPQWSEDSFPGILTNVTAGRIANRLDLGGTNYTVDAACASSLAAVYLAVLELERGRSRMAIVGAADCLQNPFAYLCFSKTRALSPRGRCRTFDQQADGIVLGEGVAMLVLKRLADAEADGDIVHAVIKGVGASSDGRDRSLTAPRREGQVTAFRRAYGQAGFSPATVGLIEAHGTGTVLGDQVELEALSALLRSASAGPRTCGVGSVKSMIGHTKSTAGIAGMIKAILALRHRVLPPTLGVEEPNRVLQEEDCPLYVNARTRPWINSRRPEPRRAGVSALGFGGTNFHVVLEEYRANLAAIGTPGPCHQDAELFLFRETSAAALRGKVRQWRRWLERADGRPRLADLALGAWQEAAGAEGGVTLALVAASADDLAAHLERADVLLTGTDEVNDPRGIYWHPQPDPGGIAFLFPGQGSQYVDMLADVAVRFPAVHDLFARSDALLREQLEEPLARVVYPPSAFSRQEERRQARALARTRYAQPAMGTADLALFELLTGCGVRPDMAGGHSYGEYAALCAAGVFAFDDLVRLSEARGRFIVESADPEPGTMAAVRADRDRVAAILADRPGVWIANLNSPEQTIISGLERAVQEAVQEFTDAGVAARTIPVACAFHSPVVAGAAARLQEFLADMTLGAPAFPVYSNRTAAPYPATRQGIVRLLAEHLVHGVEFIRQVEAMFEAGARLFVEVGPGRVLSGLVDAILADRPHLALPTNLPGRPGMVSLLHCLGRLAAHGVGIDLDLLFRDRDLEPVSPARPAAGPDAPATAWLVNGGRARPLQGADAPPLQPMDPSLLCPGAGQERPVQAGPAPPAGMAGADDQVLARYQQMMQTFLDTQAGIMKAWLGAAGPSAASPAPPPAAAPGAGADTEPAPEAAVAGPPAGEGAPADAPAAGKDVAATLRAIVSERTGYPPEMLGSDMDLEGELGIDSIKRVEILGALVRTLFPHDPEQAAAELGSCRTLGEIITTVQQIADRAGDSAGRDGGPPDSGEPDSGAQDMRQVLLAMVSERTGYPPEMLGLDMDLEGELGIDSIKRVEILGAFAGRLPAEIREGGEILERMRGCRTLAGILACVGEAAGAGQMHSVSSGPLLPRHLLTTAPAAVQAEQKVKPPRDGWILVTDDGQGLAGALVDRIRQEGGRAAILALPPGTGPAGADPQSLLDALRREHGPVRGLVHLAPLAGAPALAELDLAAWEQRIGLETGSLFRLLQLLAGDLRAGPDSVVLAATAMGGCFAVEGSPAFLPSQGGVPGLLKTVAEEWPGVRVRCVDLDPALEADRLPEILATELLLDDQAVEVGWTGQGRCLPALEARPLAGSGTMPLDGDSVVLVTGGARGITAGVALELARQYRPTLVLVGSSPLPPEQEDSVTAGLEDEAGIKAALIAAAGSGGGEVSLAGIEQRYRALLREREMRANLAAMQATGARIVYRRADVRSREQFGGLLENLYAEFGRIDGVIHGAGIIEDKLLVDKSPDSFARVVSTKADSVFLLSRHLRPQSLKFLVLFSSVAGRFGNPGQCDYTAANEIVNKMARFLDARWPCRVVSVNWGPWAREGMVSPALERQFAERGVRLIDPEQGVAALLAEIAGGGRGEVEVILGDGPWGAVEEEACAR